LVYGNGKESRQFCHSGQSNSGYDGILPRDPGDYEIAFDIECISSNVQTIRVTVAVGYWGGHALHFNGDIKVLRAPD